MLCCVAWLQRKDAVGGFEGALAHVRYHSRALSPIHVRIVCDQDQPQSQPAPDRHAFQVRGCMAVRLLLRLAMLCWTACSSAVRLARISSASCSALI